MGKSLQASNSCNSSDEFTINRLELEFVNKKVPYSIRRNWIKQLYVRNECNENHTREALRRDEKIRKKVENQHNERKDVKCSKRKTTLEDQIDSSVRERNLSLEDLARVPSSELMFDLHWFLKVQALGYVRDIEQAVRDDPNRANATDIHLITGSGVSKGKPPAIRKALKREYAGRIRVSEEDHGVLILTVYK